MKWLRKKTDGEFIESVRKLQSGQGIVLRMLFGAVGIAIFVLAAELPKIIMNFSADMETARRGIYAGFALGISFGLLASVMVVHGLFALTYCLGRGHLHRTQKLLLKYYDQAKEDDQTTTN